MGVLLILRKTFQGDVSIAFCSAWRKQNLTIISGSHYSAKTFSQLIIWIETKRSLHFYVSLQTWIYLFLRMDLFLIWKILCRARWPKNMKRRIRCLKFWMKFNFWWIEGFQFSAEYVTYFFLKIHVFFSYSYHRLSVWHGLV